MIVILFTKFLNFIHLTKFHIDVLYTKMTSGLLSQKIKEWWAIKELKLAQLG